jgi:hypothetical protein
LLRKFCTRRVRFERLAVLRVPVLNKELLEFDDNGP